MTRNWLSTWVPTTDRQPTTDNPLLPRLFCPLAQNFPFLRVRNY
jgi:hypothetical protein